MVFYFKARPDAGDYTIFMGLDKFENEELIKYGIPEDVCEVAVVADSYRSCWDEVAMGLVEEQNKNCFKENNKHFLIVEKKRGNVKGSTLKALLQVLVKNCLNPLRKYAIQETMPEVESNSLRCMQKME
ncbi:hypothetical protein F2Q69_00014627 [Brassica cretica]|uniref:Uncharacterized protein n=1 Tax=Brassica cretica TaxID=69181 RepID=A0A8S9QXQ7_BRACR|nr:hypothetical protein F2Q69_00014627 [Brassica cretica]